MPTFQLARIIRGTHISLKFISSDNFALSYGIFLMYIDPQDQASRALFPLMRNVWGHEDRIHRHMLENVKLPFGIPSDLLLDPNEAALEIYRVLDDIPAAETGNVVLEKPKARCDAIRLDKQER